jgi:DNA repair protein SbcC/Rad50
MIERLRLRNFRRYRDVAIDFEAGMNFIHGPNNVGKTTLFFAIEYALFGRVENFKTIRALMQPGKRSLGVEIVFTGQDGERLLLQRIHQTPPKSKKTLEGHFTLKALLDDGEKYLLASDFGDTEDKLALKLQELTGLTRRFFSVALHMRQGEIPAILDGSKQLDIVLGVTAASMAEDELRQMALDLEKESAALPVLLERIRSVENELAQVQNELSGVTAEQKSTAAKLAALGEAADPRLELERQLAPLVQAMAEYENRHRDGDLARRRLADERERWDESVKSGSRETVEQELLQLDSQTAARAKTAAKLRGELEAIVSEEQKLHGQRGDLAGRIQRRQGLPRAKGAKCEVCGAAIDAAQTKKELALWAGEAEQLDKKIAELKAKHAKTQESLDAEDAAERKQLERLAQLKEQRDRLAALEDRIARRQTEGDAAIAAEKAAFAAVEAEAKGLAAIARQAGVEARGLAGSEPAAALASLREAVQTLKQAVAETAGRRLAQRQALTDLLQRFETQTQSLARRQSDLEREQAVAKANAGGLQVKEARAERFRRISAGFKDFQVQVRGEAATRLAANTLALHRRLAQTDEFESIGIDPAHYSLHVVPKDLGEEVPAALYEGGGHRLLLGLAYRLAIARLVGASPFLLLDEPTYGLDPAHREAMLDRIGDKELANQVLLVTHHARPDLAGNRITMAKRDKESVVE